MTCYERVCVILLPSYRESVYRRSLSSELAGGVECLEQSRESHRACLPVSPALCCGVLGSGKLRSVTGWEGVGEGWMGVCDGG